MKFRCQIYCQGLKAILPSTPLRFHPDLRAHRSHPIRTLVQRLIPRRQVVWLGQRVNPMADISRTLQTHVVQQIHLIGEKRRSGSGSD